MEPEFSTTPVKQAPRPKSRVPKVFWLITILLVLLLAAGGYLFATKQLIYTPTAATPSTIRATAPCNSSVIAEYNLAMSYQFRGNDKEATLDKTTLKKIETEIPTKAGYADDPTCQTMLFWIAVQNSDVTKAKASLVVLQKLHDEGKYVDSNLGNSAPLSTFDLVIKSLIQESQV